MYINWARRELNLKIVYYGPALSGKTTNLVQIHARVLPEARSELISLATAQDRTLFFDFLELKPRKILGLTPRIQLYTVPGQPRYEASRRLVLRGADGVVFVADSELNRLRDNVLSWCNMRHQLAQQGIAWAGFPLVVQLNKRDLPSAIALDHFVRAMRMDGRFPLLEARAIEGAGVLDTLRAIVGRVVTRVQRELKETVPVQ